MKYALVRDEERLVICKTFCGFSLRPWENTAIQIVQLGFQLELQRLLVIHRKLPVSREYQLIF